MKRALKYLSVFVCIMIVFTSVTACKKKDSDSKSGDSDTSVSADSASDTRDPSDTDSDSTAADGDGSGSESGKSEKSGGSGESGADVEISMDAASNEFITIDSLDDDDNGNGTGGGSGNNAGGNNGSNGSGSKSGSSDSKSSGNGSSAKSGSTSGSNGGNSGSNSKSNGSSNSSSSTKSSVKLSGKEKTFVITLYPDIAPITCANFQKLVNDGYYNGLKFTRVIDNFLAQAGAKKENGTGTSGTAIKGEFSSNGFKNSLSHTKGVVSMYREPTDPNSADSQFFICYNDNCKFMDGNYAAFGKVTEGYSNVEAFQNVDRETGYDGAESKPVTPITIVLAESAGKDSSGNPKIKFYVTY